MLHIIYEPTHDANPIDIASSPSQKFPLPSLFISVYLPHAVRVILFWPCCFPHLSALEVNLLYHYLSQISQDDDEMYLKDLL